MKGRRDPFANSADYVQALSHATLAALPGIGDLPQEGALDTVRVYGKSGSVGGLNMMSPTSQWRRPYFFRAPVCVFGRGISGVP